MLRLWQKEVSRKGTRAQDWLLIFFTVLCEIYWPSILNR
jgi:hypothetical protein